MPAGTTRRHGPGAPVLLRALATIGLAMAIASCGTTVDDLPLPEPGSDAETYTLHAVFENALNLPDRAKVRIGGSDVGVVTAISAKNFHAVVEMEIDADISLPEGSTAELRQATPLGDVFIALSEPRGGFGSGILADGDTLTLESTSAGATVEELLISVSMLFTGGGMANLGRLGTELGSILDGQGGNLSHLITEMTGVVGELNNNSARIDGVLSEFNTLADTIESNHSQLREVADTLPQALGAVAENTRAITDLLTTISTAGSALGEYSTTTGDQLAQLLTNLDNLMGAMAAAGSSVGYTLDQLHSIRPSLDATLRGKSFGAYVTLTNLDIGLLTSPEDSKLWDINDIDDFVGSFLQVLQVVQGRLGGR